MLTITTNDLAFELFTGSPYEKGAVHKYFLTFPDTITAAIYPSGIVKSVSDRHVDTVRTLGGSFVALEPDVRTGGYITRIPTKEQLDTFQNTLRALSNLKAGLLAGKEISITRRQQMRYETHTPTDQELLSFFKRIKTDDELTHLAREVNAHVGPMDIIHPDIGDRDYLAFSFCQGCDGACVKCNFQHARHLLPRAKQELQDQIQFYKEIFSPEERRRFEIFAGNHRGLGIDLPLFTEYVHAVREEAGMSKGRVFAFCNAEDILRLHEEYGKEELEKRMLQLGLHLNLGVESGSPAGLKAYGKNMDLRSIRKALLILKGMQVPYSVNIIAGVDWENHVYGTTQLFRSLYRPHDNRPAVYSSEFIHDDNSIDKQLESAQYSTFRTVLNDCGIYVFRYTFVPFNGSAS